MCSKVRFFIVFFIWNWNSESDCELKLFVIMRKKSILCGWQGKVSKLNELICCFSVTKWKKNTWRKFVETFIYLGWLSIHWSKNSGLKSAWFLLKEGFQKLYILCVCKSFHVVDYAFLRKQENEIPLCRKTRH